MKSRKFTDQQKQRILRDAEANGVTAASKANRVVKSLIYKWRRAVAPSVEAVKTRVNGNAANDATDSLNDEIARLQRLLTRSILKPGSVEIVNDFREVAR